MSCYFVIGTDPEKVRGDGGACGRQHGNGRVASVDYDRQLDQVTIRIRYESRDEAQRNLEPLKNCFEQRGNRVVRYGVD